MLEVAFREAFLAGAHEAFAAHALPFGLQLELIDALSVVEEASVLVGEGGEGVNGWVQILCHTRMMQTFVRSSNA